MTGHVLSIFRRFLTAPFLTTTKRPSRRQFSRRSSARWSLIFAGVTFLALSIGLLATLEDVHPEWRDPEYGSRLKQLQDWKKKAPDRPLILAIGTSRIQFELSPAAMGFSHEPDEPLVYNLGYQGGQPNIAILMLLRVLDAGIRPRCVLMEFVPPSYVNQALNPGDTFSEFIHKWPSRFSLRDLARIGELQESPGHSHNPDEMMRWLSYYITPWSSQRLALLSEWFPNWLPDGQKRPIRVLAHPSDQYGHAPILATSVSEETRRANLASVREVRGKLAARLAKFGRVPPLQPMIDKLVKLCEAEGIRVAFVWLPESPAFEASFPEFQPIGEQYAAELTHKYDVTLFPARGAPEEDFMDGVHMLPDGAERYSRWLADVHLKPWLLSLGLMKEKR